MAFTAQHQCGSLGNCNRTSRPFIPPSGTVRVSSAPGERNSSYSQTCPTTNASLQEKCGLTNQLTNSYLPNGHISTYPVDCTCWSLLSGLTARNVFSNGYEASYSSTIGADPSMNLTLLADCCSGCQVIADRVEVIFWHVDTKEEPSTITTTVPMSTYIVDSEGFTL